MATTPNYGWVTPAPTDFVTDLPADFETFADAVDADLAGLLGGTTGQILTKDSNTDHDFSWQAAPAASSMIQLATGVLDGSSNIRIQSIPGTYKMLRLFIRNPLGSITNFTSSIKVNNDTGSNYRSWMDYGYVQANTVTFSTSSYFSFDASNTTGDGFAWIDFPDYADSNHWKTIIVHGSIQNDKTTATSIVVMRNIIVWNQDTAINEVDIVGSANFTSGSYVLYGVN